MTRRAWRIVHNCIVHPMMELLPESWGDWLHDETARRAGIVVTEEVAS